MLASERDPEWFPGWVPGKDPTSGNYMLGPGKDPGKGKEYSSLIRELINPILNQQMQIN